MTPERLWDTFVEAQNAHMFFDRQKELGQTGTYGDLKKSYYTVINYWLYPQTIGGSIMMRTGYIKNLPSAVRDYIDEYNDRVNIAKKEIIENIFKK